MNPAAESVKANADVSPAHRYVRDHGRSFIDTETTWLGGREVTISTSLTDADRERVADIIENTDPTKKACFQNALESWNYDDDLSYVEGYASVESLDGFACEHAWNMLNGNLVDVTNAYSSYYGVVFEDDDCLGDYYDIGVENNSWGIIGNHIDNNRFLREREYI